MSSTLLQKTSTPWQWRLWRQWVLTNAASETVGLGATLLIGAFLLVNAEKTIGVVLAAALGVLAGTVIEGSVVGTAQWLVLHRPLQHMKWRAWAGATALGAGIAWTLGMIPSILLSTSPDTGTAPPGEVSDLLVYALAAGMGLILGPFQKQVDV